jgi:hypothetical protein
MPLVRLVCRQLDLDMSRLSRNTTNRILARLGLCMTKSVLQTIVMHRFGFRDLNIFNAARILLALGLLTAFAADFIPIASVTAGSRCVLQCCAGKTPHASGSCMTGSCHAVLAKTHLKQSTVKANHTEKFCGLRLTSKTLRQSHQAAPLQSSSIGASRSFERPCQADCGSCVAGFVNSGRENFAAANRTHLRTQSQNLGRSTFEPRPSNTLKAQARLGSPRGPPFLNS